MIPQGRDAIDAEGIAQLLGMAYKTFRNKGGAAAVGLQPFTPGRRKPLYDRAQAEAVRDGRPLPTWPVGTREHPDDLLDEQDAAEALGVEYSTVRKDRSTGRLPGWITVCRSSGCSRRRGAT
ncbi:hypothetical protein AB0D67_38555 [Streptosporangium sp. NPDC048047]|uniref:hypothetical protein n=1 Tax=Streptosporangium sp. NPDC048047 TaxID=3155748 RepID=UPI003437D590